MRPPLLLQISVSVFDPKLLKLEGLLTGDKSGSMFDHIIGGHAFQTTSISSETTKSPNYDENERYNV